jgi:hypothetical protein
MIRQLIEIKTWFKEYSITFVPTFIVNIVELDLEHTDCISFLNRLEFVKNIVILLSCNTSQPEKEVAVSSF